MFGFKSNVELKEEVHFICIDRRTKKDGGIYIMLENGQHILLPPNVTCVPALLLLNRGHRVVVGEEIKSYLVVREEHINAQSTGFNGEPLAFSMGEFGTIMSDNYSFLDQNSPVISTCSIGISFKILNLDSSEVTSEKYPITIINLSKIRRE